MKKNITMTISNHCNMDVVANGCSYCCIQNRNTSPVLSLEQAMTFIERDLAGVDVGMFEFFGGEPTLHFDVIEKIVERYDYPYRMYTNGLFDFDMWKDTLIKFDEVCFSHDGPGKFNSKRGVGNNEEVSSICLRNIDNAISYGIPVTVAIVPSLLRHYDSLPDIFRFFMDRGVRSFTLETPSIIQDNVVNMKFGSEQWDKILDFFFHSVVPDFLEYDYDDKYLFNIPREHYPGQANASPCSETNIAISPRGNIYVCRDTSANEERLNTTQQIKFYSSVPDIQEIEKSHTCHVKVLQGYSHESIIHEGNKQITQMMYAVIGLMNKFYRDVMLDDSVACEKDLGLIQTFLFLHSQLEVHKECKKLNTEMH